MNRCVGQWCTIVSKHGMSLECRVSKVTAEAIEFDEKLEVYQEIPRLRPAEAVIEPCVGWVPREVVQMVKTSSKARAEDFCRKMNTTHLVATSRRNN